MRISDWSSDVCSSDLDAGLSQQRWRVSVDFRDEGAERSASETARRCRRRAAPAHAQNLCQEAGLDDAGEARNAIGKGMVQHRGDQRVADAQPLSGAVADRQAQPGYLASGRAGRHARWTQLREEARENVGLLRREQTQRADMVTGLIERDQVGRVIAVELVDFPAVLLDREIPSEKIDEQPFAVFEHGVKRTAQVGVTTP